MPLSAKRLREAREAKGYKQRDLAKLCNITEFQISRYENERTDITATTLQLLAHHLEVSTDYLLGLSNNPRGQLGDTEFSEEEYNLVQTLRRDGWFGVIRSGLDRVEEAVQTSAADKDK